MCPEQQPQRPQGRQELEATPGLREQEEGLGRRGDNREGAPPRLLFQQKKSN